MFWKRKQMVATPATVGTTTSPMGIISSAAKAEVLPQPKTEKVRVEKLPRPQEIPELAGRHLVVAKKKGPDWVWHLKAVVRKNPSRGKRAFDVRVFDESQVAQKKVKIKDWTTFDQHPDLILYEGWFDKESMRAELEERKAAQPVPAK